MPSLRNRSAALLLVVALASAACSELTFESPVSSGGLDAITDTGAVIAPDLDPTPLPTDPAVAIGTLANGLTYIARTNRAPGSSIELRLVINVGSTQQPTPDSGAAHFLEHMLFNGTERFPANELESVLRSFGMQIGPDLNAYTSYDETVYELSVPTNDPESVALGLDVLREWAGRATIDADEVIAERGVVREELRLATETKDAALSHRFDEIYTADSGYAGHNPIGTEEAILATTAADLRSFYDDWYRPDLMAVVAVGDVPADDLVAMIEDRFSDLEPRGDSPTLRPIETAPLDTLVVDVLALPDGPEPAISIDFGLPSWDPSTVGGERQMLADQVIAAMIDHRLNELAESGAVDFVRPVYGVFDYTRQRRFAGLNTTALDLAAGTEQILIALRSLREDGFTDADLELARAATQAALDQERASADGFQDAEYAAAYTAHFLSGAAIDTPGRRHERLTATLDSFTAAGMSGYYRWLMDQVEPLILLYGDDQSPLPSTEAIEEAVANAATADTFERGETTAIGALMEAPDPVEPSESAVLSAVPRARSWTFPNHTTVIFAPSTIDAAEVQLMARSNGGTSLLEPGEAALASTATAAVDASSVNGIDPTAFNDYLRSRTVWLQSVMDATSEGFFGGASVTDVEVMFQLLHLRMTASQIDGSGLAATLDLQRNTLREAESNPSFASAIAWQNARYEDDERHALVPSATALDRVTPEQLLSIYQARLGSVDDLVVIVVGDIDADTIEDLARRYIATLPVGDADEFIDWDGDPPVGPIELRIDAGIGDASAGVDFYYSARRPWSTPDEATAEVLRSIIDARLFTQVREVMGASYGGGQSQVVLFDEPADEIFAAVSTSGDPARLAEIRAAVETELADLVGNGPTSAELEQAVQVVLADAAFTSNFDLMTRLLQSALHGDDSVEDPETFSRRVDALSGDQVRDLARSVFSPEALILVTRAPS